MKKVFLKYFFILFLILLIPNKTFAKTEYSDYLIENYDIEIIVNENNTYNITEKISINSNTEKNLIYKKIPLKNNVIRLDGSTYSNKVKISNIEVDEKYTIYDEKEFKIIEIEDNNKTFIIKYTYDVGKDSVKNADEFYYSLIGNEWNASISNVSFKITMPKAFDESLLGFSSGSIGKSNVSYSIDGNVITGFLKETLNPGQELTVRLILPEGYFVGASSNINILSIITGSFIILLFIYCMFNYFLYKEKNYKAIPPSECYELSELSSAEVGYIFNNYKTNLKQPISLLLSIANKGYIKINENEKKFEVINLNPIPKQNKEINNISKRCIKVTKLKDADTTLNDYEKMIMEYLFKKSKSKNITANFDKFDKAKNKLVKNGFIKIISDNLEEINKEKERNKEIIESYKKELIKYKNNIKKLPKLSNYEKELYDNLFRHETKIEIENCREVCDAIYSVEYALEMNCKKEMINKKAYKKKKQIITISIIMSAILLTSYLLYGDLPIVLYLVQGLIILASLICGITMKYKTYYGEEITSIIKGFKRFLVKSEKNKLEELTTERPSYFYDILPYAYVLNISKSIIKKFENISIVNNKLGFNYNNTSNYNKIYKQFRQSIEIYNKNKKK